MSGGGAHERGAGASCHLRAMREPGGRVRIVTRNVSLSVEGQLGLDEKSEHPSALDLLVASLAADLLAGLGREAAKSGTPLHEAELRLEAYLDNPLVALGVIGESGHAGLAGIAGTLSVSTDATHEALEALWRRALDHAPVYLTLNRTLPVRVELRRFA